VAFRKFSLRDTKSDILDLSIRTIFSFCFISDNARDRIRDITCDAEGDGVCFQAAKS
jgi:hypothetical protein